MVKRDARTRTNAQLTLLSNGNLVKVLQNTSIDSRSQAATRPTMDLDGKRRSARKLGINSAPKAALMLLAASIPLASGQVAQLCVPLAGSTLCPAFNESSISTDPTLIGLLLVYFHVDIGCIANILQSFPFFRFQHTDV